MPVAEPDPSVDDSSVPAEVDEADALDQRTAVDLDEDEWPHEPPRPEHSDEP